MKDANDKTIIQLSKAMVFHRILGDGQALMLGTLTLERNDPISVTGRYLLDMGVNPSLFTEQELPIRYNDKSVTYKLLTVNEKLKNSTWQGIEKDAPREFAVVELLPLIEEKGIYCFFAALERPALDGNADSFHQFDGQFWNQIVSPTKTIGSTPDQVFEKPIWDIEGNKYSINARNDEGFLYYQIKSKVFAECGKKNLSAKECESALIEELKEKMKPEDIPTYHGMSIYSEPEYIKFLVYMQKNAPSVHTRIMSKSDYDERRKAVSAAIAGAHNEPEDKNNDSSFSM